MCTKIKTGACKAEETAPSWPWKFLFLSVSSSGEQSKQKKEMWPFHRVFLPFSWFSALLQPTLIRAGTQTRTRVMFYNRKQMNSCCVDE